MLECFWEEGGGCARFEREEGYRKNANLEFVFSKVARLFSRLKEGGGFYGSLEHVD